MSTLVADLTTTELENIIEKVLERKLSEMLANPESLMHDSVRERLLLQQTEVSNGELGISFDDLVNEIGLANV